MNAHKTISPSKPKTSLHTARFLLSTFQYNIQDSSPGRNNPSYGHRIIDIQKKPEIPNSGVNSNTDIWMRKKNDRNLLKCEMCVDSFTKFCDLEFHIKKKHETYKEQECDHCGKSFVTTWRLRKHMRIHSQFTKNCRYFQAGMACPFEELGCKFLHSLPEKLILVQF